MSEVVSRADQDALYRLWSAHGSRMTWQRVIERGGDREVAEMALAELPDVTPLVALEANRRLVDLLTVCRWYAMQAAREAGATWAEIGEALGMTRQGAQHWYAERVERQERYTGELHDAERARAVIAEYGPTTCGAPRCRCGWEPGR